MVSLEEIFQSACVESKIPGAVLAASNDKGSLSFSHAFGVKSLKAEHAPEPLRSDSIFWLASCAKIVTAIAALQCVEQGRFTLDEDVTRLLPELQDMDIITGFDEKTEKPLLVKAKNTITLRHLLSHTSGFEYEAFGPLLSRWRRSTGEEPKFGEGPIVHRCLTPLLFEPGESFGYSTGFEWTGKLIERATGTSLEDYVQRNICQPLGISDVTFRLEDHPDLMERFVDISVRTQVTGSTSDIPSSTKLEWTPFHIWGPKKEDWGGTGLYGSAGGFLKILQSVTAGDGRLLGPEMKDELFKNQLNEAAEDRLNEIASMPGRAEAFGIPGINSRLGNAFGGLKVLDDTKGRRRGGTISWGGMTNTRWWADRRSGLCGVYAVHVLPPNDEECLRLFVEFEKAMYERVAQDA